MGFQYSTISVIIQYRLSNHAIFIARPPYSRLGGSGPLSRKKKERNRTMKQVSPEGLKWFQDARFGMFIHWGLYSILARGEWVMHHENIPVPEYEALMQQFNP